MGKSKSKKFQLKTYAPPPEKFLVIVNAWTSQTSHPSQSFVNNVGGWFEVMLKDEYPGTKVDAVYFQSTHKNIIIELPSHVDVLQYLGAHDYARFLHQRYYDGKPNVAYIYEYKYEYYDHPSHKNWSSLTPSYPPIPPNFPVKFPYPLPAPAPPPPREISAYTKAIPANLEFHPDLQPPMEADGLDALLPSNCYGAKEVDTSSFIPYETPSALATRIKHEYGQVTFADVKTEISIKIEGQLNDIPVKHEPAPDIPKKMDPYEEAEVAEALLRSLPPVKQEHFDDGLKHEPAFDDSLISAPIEESYEPSAELLASFATLAPESLEQPHGGEVGVIVKSEPENDYAPSAELLTSFASLQQQDLDPLNFINQAIQSTEQVHLKEGLQEERTIRVKDEPRDDSIPLSINDRESSHTLTSGSSRNTPLSDLRPTPIAPLKYLPEDSARPSWNPRMATTTKDVNGRSGMTRVKQELDESPISLRHAPAHDPDLNSRDPRIRAQALARRRLLPEDIGVKREHEDVSRNTRDPRQRTGTTGYRLPDGQVRNERDMGSRPQRSPTSTQFSRERPAAEYRSTKRIKTELD